eukprot:ANDGO_08120.mRNA.1 Centrosomal protein POC5 OS=Rattus norvegicus GN=Poc5 PE=1 SV=1
MSVSRSPRSPRSPPQPSRKSVSGPDADVYFAASLDEQLHAFRQGMLGSYRDFKERLQAEEEDKWNMERWRIEDRLVQLEDENTDLKARLADAEREFQMADYKLDSSFIFIRTLKKKERKAAAFAAWKQWVAERKQRKLVGNLARAHGEQLAIRKAFSEWRSDAYLSRKERSEELWMARLDLAGTKMQKEYEEKIAGLERKLAEARAEIEVGLRHKLRLEDNLKKAFMRGVCALNMEAMSILRENSPQGAGAGTGGGADSENMFGGEEGLVLAQLTTEKIAQQMTHPSAAAHSHPLSQQTVRRPASGSAATGMTTGMGMGASMGAGTVPMRPRLVAGSAAVTAGMAQTATSAPAARVVRHR